MCRRRGGPCRRLIGFGGFWRLGPLDLRGLAQVRDERGLRLLHDIAGDLVLDLVEGAERFSVACPGPR